MEILGYLALFAVFCGGLLSMIVGFVMLMEGVKVFRQTKDTSAVALWIGMMLVHCVIGLGYIGIVFRFIFAVSQ